jgi:hypothetical protein
MNYIKINKNREKNMKNKKKRKKSTTKRKSIDEKVYLKIKKLNRNIKKQFS